MIDKEKIHQILSSLWKNDDSVGKMCYNQALQDVQTAIDLQEEPVSIWHDASEEPNDKSSCLIHYIVGGEVSYRDIFPVLYNKEAREFVSEPYPHPTGYNVEQSSLEGGVVAEVYKDMRDRFLISDIYKWAYIDDLLNLSNVERTGKNWKEEPVSEDLEEAAKKHAVERFRTTRDEFLAEKCKWSFKAGAQWQKAKDESITEDLGEYINELSKQFPEVSFAKLSRIAVRVAKWQKEQFEKNRLAACDRQTAEDAERESDFVMSVIEKEHRQPTFDDAIKYGMRLREQQMMANAVEGVVHHFEKCKVASVHYNDPTGVPMAYFTSPEGLSVGDKVKIIVIKEG